MKLTVLVPQDLAEPVKVGVAILVIAKAASAVVATLYDLQRDTVNVTAWTPGHERSPAAVELGCFFPPSTCWKTTAMLIEANPSEIRAILGAMQQVITARNTLPISEIDNKTLPGAYKYMFGQTGDIDIDALPKITPNELASALTDRELSINALRFMAVCAFVDGALNKQRIVIGFSRYRSFRWSIRRIQFRAKLGSGIWAQSYL
jgi:hypothetical protein